MTTVAPTKTAAPVRIARRAPSAPQNEVTLGTGLRKFLFYLLLLAMVVVFITPYLFALMAAFKPLSEVTTDKAWQLPTHFTWTNFSDIFSKYDFGNYLVNTVIVTVILTIGQVTFSLMGAYAFARLKFPGREALFWVYLAMLMVPNVVTMIPLYVIMSKTGLINTYWAIFLPYVLGTPYAVFLMRQYLLTIPGEVIEAARLDGCSDLKILRKVIVPMSRPIIITATLLAVVFSWNNFLWPLIATDSNSLQVLTVGIANFNSNFTAQWNLVLAGSFVALIPMVLLFAFFQKDIVRSVNLSGASR
jgi:multiple sugar transport system permease protein